MARFNTTFQIGKFCNAPILIHWSTLLFLFIFYILNYQEALTFSLALISVLFHEFGHVLAAYYFRINTSEILMLPIGGVAKIQTQFDNFHRDFWIILAGPFVNLIIFVHSFIIYYYFNNNIFLSISAINLILFVFNLIPIFPMDGGMLIRGILHLITKNYYKATLYSARISQGLAFSLCCITLYYKLYLISITFLIILILAEMQLSSIKYYESSKMPK